MSRGSTSASTSAADPLWRLRRGSALAWTVVVLAVFWVPNDGDPTPAHADKLVHAGAFASLAWAWAWAGRIHDARRLAIVIAAVGALAIVSEVVQPWLPWPRTFDVLDLGLDFVGLAAGALGWWWSQTHKRRSLEVG